jgi:GAF domain-containing protein
MNLTPVDQAFQLIAWFIALMEIMAALYILLLNVWHTTNRHASVFLLLSAFSTLALGFMEGATDVGQAALPTYLIAAIAPASGPWLFLLSMALLRPDWLRGRWRWAWWVVVGASLVPALLILVDSTPSEWRLSTGLWYTGLNAETYAGGFVPLSTFAAGRLALPIKILYLWMMPILAMWPALHVVAREKKPSEWRRRKGRQGDGETKGMGRLARLLLGADAIALAIQFGLPGLLSGGGGVTPPLFGSTLLAVVYVYTTLQQMRSERRTQRGRLLPRLTALVLISTVPFLVMVVIIVSTRAGMLIERNALERLRETNRAVASNISIWLDLNARALQELASQPDIISMEPERQKPLLEAMVAAYPHMYLASTTDRSGSNVARSDDLPHQNYRGELWHTSGRNGVPLTYEVFVDQATGQPTLVASVPIQRVSDKFSGIVGVAMFASSLTDIAQEVQASQPGEAISAYVVDAQNRVVAHTNQAPAIAASSALQDIDTYPPVFAMRGGTRGLTAFTDDDADIDRASGERWLAYVDELDNGWGVVVQQREAELLEPLRLFRQVSWSVLVVGTVLLGIMVSVTIRQAIRPIGTLTEAATAVAAGDLSYVTPVESNDETGILARAFNGMTAQLRDLIGNLEQRVAEQTRDLEKRAVHLEAAAQVARGAAAIRDVKQLLEETVHLISNRFGFYHAGIFLLDDRKEYAVLQAASSPGGQRMLAREHKLKVGEVGIVGYAAGTGKPRIALDVGADSVYFDNPDLPTTRSEMGLPLKVRGQVIGVLDVQSTEERAFSDEDVAILQTMADQIGIAIENARLLEETQQALRELETAYSLYTQESWQGIARRSGQPLGYRYRHLGIESAVEQAPEARQAWREGRPVVVETPLESEDNQHGIVSGLAVPMKLRDQVVGVLNLRFEGQPASPDAISLIEQIASRLALALENARLLEETHGRAERERITANITARIRASMDPQTILQTAVRELGTALGTDRTFVHLGIDRGTGRQGDGRTERQGDERTGR